MMRTTSALDHDIAARWSAVRSQHPTLWRALVADARVTAIYRGERFEFRSRTDALVQCLRLMAVSDAFLAQALYRLKARLQALGVPVLPRVAHHLAKVLGQVCIGDPVVVAPGLYLYHGHVVIDGFTQVGPGARIAPFVTIGLQAGSVDGPTIGANVSIGTGAKILGAVRVGNRSVVGANAVVVSDVPPRSIATGIPARSRPAPAPSSSG
jgi:serine O-acetyltransferase